MYTVMIAEDEAIYRKALTVFVEWEKLDCRIIYTASNGKQVLENIETVSPDILITDIRMPGADGIEVISYIQEHKLPVVSIILTAYADFSYAQAAFRYQVADYVVKSGAFDELAKAVEKAKILVNEQRAQRKREGEKETLQGIYKSIFDGSIFLQDDMERQLEKVQLKKKYGQVLLYLFQNRENLCETGQKKVNYSLQNFFSMVYGEKMSCAIPMSWERMAILLESDIPLKRSWFLQKSEQAVDMMENFMNLNIYICVSNIFTTVQELPKAYEETIAILDNNFLDDLEKTSFYEDIRTIGNGYNSGLEAMNKQICQSVRMGRGEEAQSLFQKLLEKQRSEKYSANAIKGSGILLQNECRGMLKEFNQSLYDITSLNPSITKKITSCTSYEEYVKLMAMILQKTADFFRRVVDKKDYLVKRCKEYIERHYDKDFSVAEAARSLGTSSSYLSRIYKENTGSTIIYDLNRKRVDMAEYYLKEKQLKIYEVAELTGFKDVTYFSHIFKAYTGMSPKQFQSQL